MSAHTENTEKLLAMTKEMSDNVRAMVEVVPLCIEDARKSPKMADRYIKDAAEALGGARLEASAAAATASAAMAISQALHACDGAAADDDVDLKVIQRNSLAALEISASNAGYIRQATELLWEATH